MVPSLDRGAAHGLFASGPANYLYNLIVSPSAPGATDSICGDKRRLLRTGWEQHDVGFAPMLGELLRRDRERAGLSIGQAAVLLGVKPAEYRRLEDEAVWPDWETYDRLRAVRLVAVVQVAGEEGASSQRRHRR
jgi:hypothetical protein